ncbi:DUF3828 domain-containing protein [Pluralibacter sp.]|uniref:DUF3828 domain-containing protein n=1 Tax=Pluralibacter sp. TaxID=1920032 RepID=UPI0025D2DD97|nr:DUF3828 domain-containing protein [Pluralibacter sp.]MBV8042351.1 DUF3828 domain-containing protein [Pluralibacter sp.]
MKKLLLLIAILLTGCSSVTRQSQQAKVQTEKFYRSYLTAFGSDEAKPYPIDELRKYVAADTVARIDAVQNIPEQELMESDYFTYVQDYSREWVPMLRIGNAQPFLGGEVVQVMEGVGNGGYIHLEAFLRHEEGTWKIYRVRDVTNDHEHPIFNAGAITRAKAAAGTGL